MKSRFAVVALLGSSVALCTAFGSSITIFNTGEGPGGTALPIGETDPNYTLISAPAGVPLTAITTTPYPTWTPNTVSADWISPSSNSNTNWPTGNYDYETTFDLPAFVPGTTQLSGFWTSDNNACMYLNNVNTGVCTAFGDFGSLAAFSITTGFQPGVNTLDFMVTNGAPSPTGLLVELSGSVIPLSTPEPSSLLLMSTGLFFGLGRLLRRRQS